MRKPKGVMILLGLMFSPAIILAQNGDLEEITKLKNELSQTLIAVQQLREEYQTQVAALQARIAALEGEKQQVERQSELEKLLLEVKNLAGREPRKEAPLETKVFTSGERQQQSLNPNISVTGDFIGHFSTLDVVEASSQNTNFGLSGRELTVREAEFHIISNLDPFTQAKFFLGLPGLGSLHIGEAYMEWFNLPWNLGLKIGKYRTQFGVLNRWHNHGLPQVDRPRVLTQFLGGGLSGFGAAVNIVLPKLWSNVNEVDLELIYGGDGVSFTNEGDEQWVAVGHLKNYYDLTSNAFFELGFSGAFGHHHPQGSLQTALAGIDLTYKWVPAGRSKYRTFEFRNELILSRREGVAGDVSSLGFYSYLENKLDARWWLGFRFDYTQAPEANDLNTWGMSPHLTFWQSEFVFLRLQLSHFHHSFGKDENVVLLQSVWSMGPHKHEAY